MKRFPFVHPAAACLALSFALLPAACSSSTPATTMPTSGAQAQLFHHIGDYHRAVSTHVPEAQQYFDQALTWTFAFNHDEAIRSYHRAAELDPSLAIAWWGIALCNGPHINNPAMPDERNRAAYDAAQRALALRSQASPVEQALIDAVATRYAYPAPQDRRSLDEAYAAAMRGVHQRFPDDLDCSTLFAESLMDLQPWDLWTHDGQPKGNTLEIVSVLESVLALNPKHPGAAHYYIHAVEASPIPERAVAAADSLRDLVPISGHLTHMPSHIDIRTGNWAAAATANRKAISTDSAYRSLSPRQNFYRVYMMHNQQFLAFTCMMTGRSDEGIAAAHAARGILPEAWIKESAPVVDGYLPLEMDILKRFGRWDDILAAKQPPDYLPYTTAMWRCNRAVALAALGRVDEAERERALFKEDCGRVPEKALAQINPAHKVLDLAGDVLDGEIAYARKDMSTAESSLRSAVAIEDDLQYMEPPDWTVPARHTLGAVLIDAGRFADAEQVYRQDLKYWPGNGWSLLGLANAQEKQGKTAEAAETRAKLAKVWADADISPHSSCLCSPKSRS